VPADEQAFHLRSAKRGSGYLRADLRLAHSQHTAVVTGISRNDHVGAVLELASKSKPKPA
jgi:hypothetical protein